MHSHGIPSNYFSLLADKKLYENNNTVMSYLLFFLNLFRKLCTRIIRKIMIEINSVFLFFKRGIMLYYDID